MAKEFTTQSGEVLVRKLFRLPSGLVKDVKRATVEENVTETAFTISAYSLYLALLPKLIELRNQNDNQGLSDVEIILKAVSTPGAE